MKRIAFDGIELRRLMEAGFDSNDYEQGRKDAAKWFGQHKDLIERQGKIEEIASRLRSTYPPNVRYSYWVGCFVEARHY